MTLNSLLDSLFPLGHQVAVINKSLVGEARTSLGTVSVMGTTDAALIDHEICLRLSMAVLEVVEKYPQRPIVFLVDTSGQILSRAAELLCLNKSFSHLAECVDLARMQGHPTFSLVTANAVSGGFLAFGLMADRIDALQNTEVRVMDLKAMARVTKIDHQRLVLLAQSSAIFAPGAENYRRMGALEKIWDKPSEANLVEALTEIRNRADSADLRMKKGQTLGGRKFAEKICHEVQ